MRYLGTLLQDMGLTQKRLAAALGIHPSRLGALVRGDRQPTAEEKMTLEKFLKLPGTVIFEELKDGTNSRTAGTAEAAEDEFSAEVPRA